MGFLFGSSDVDKTTGLFRIGVVWSSVQKASALTTDTNTSNSPKIGSPLVRSAQREVPPRHRS